MTRPTRALQSMVAMGVLVAMAAGAALAGEAKDAEALLDAKGLKKLITSYSLEGETDVISTLKDLQGTQRKVLLAARELAQVEQQETLKKNAINGMLQLRSQIRARLAAGVNNVQLQNRMVLQLNELGDRIVALQQDEKVAAAIKESRSKFNTVREEYVEKLLAIRIQADQISEKYKDLNADAQLTAAVETLNKDNTKPLELGPSLAFKSALRALQSLEEKVLSDKIKLRPDRGNSYFVPVVFEGKYTKELCVDTGSSLICLPFEMAKEVGLEPGPSAETLKLQLADGSIVEGKAVMASSVRVGKFTVENVDCVVMPSDLKEAAPLLGMSFLKNFSYKIHSDTHELVMTKIDTPGSNNKSKVDPKKRAR